MAKSRETFGKRDKEIKRLKQRQEKREKMEERKAQAQSGKSLENMMAYLDENGNLTSVPPDPAKRKTFNAEDIPIGVPKYEPAEEDTARTGVVAFFNEAKGFGFINDEKTGERLFFHVSQTLEPITENDKVSFEVERGHKGMNAVRVKKSG